MLRSHPIEHMACAPLTARRAILPGRRGLPRRVIAVAALAVALALSASTALGDSDSLPRSGLSLIAGLAAVPAGSEVYQLMDECAQVTANPLFGLLNDELVQADAFPCGDVLPPVASRPEP
jgi:hypothetical protein